MCITDNFYLAIIARSRALALCMDIIFEYLKSKIIVLFKDNLILLSFFPNIIYIHVIFWSKSFFFRKDKRLSEIWLFLISCLLPSLLFITNCHEKWRIRAHYTGSLKLGRCDALLEVLS
jgi:hypothetical protein